MARHPNPTRPTQAGRKLREWRTGQRPKISGREAAARFGVAMRTLYRIETGDRQAPDPVKQAIVKAGVCTYADFFPDE